MFGAKKLKLKVRKRNRVYYVVYRDRHYSIYDSKGVIKVMFNIPHGNCSTIIVQNVSIYQDTKGNRDYEILNEYFKNTYNSKTIISVQNITKEAGETLKKCGFIEMLSLPGNYTNNTVSGVSSSNCISVLVYCKKDMKDALKRSKKLLELIN